MPGPAPARPSPRRAAEARKDYAAAYRGYLALARTGHYVAMYNVAHFISMGWGVPYDQEAAATWWKSLLQRNYVTPALRWNTHRRLFYLYRFNAEKRPEGIRFLRAAAAAGDLESQRLLAAALLGFAELMMGAPTKEEVEEGKRWLHKLADGGDAEGMADLGFQYYLGLKLEKHYRNAVKYLTGAARKGRGRAAQYLGDLYFDENGSNAKHLGDLDPAVVANRHAEANKWYRLALKIYTSPAAAKRWKAPALKGFIAKLHARIGAIHTIGKHGVTANADLAIQNLAKASVMMETGTGDPDLFLL